MYSSTKQAAQGTETTHEANYIINTKNTTYDLGSPNAGVFQWTPVRVIILLKKNTIIIAKTNTINVKVKFVLEQATKAQR
jgi:hypothetical protein